MGTKRGAARAFLDAALTYEGDECLPWPFARDRDGYGLVRHEGRSIHTSRVVCLLLYGEPPTPEHTAGHSCRDRSCVNPRHLSWRTMAEQSDDMRRDGTIHDKQTKLTADDVRAIRARREAGESMADLAREYGVHYVHVQRIVARTRWSWL
jgi:hypothetical protein